MSRLVTDAPGPARIDDVFDPSDGADRRDGLRHRREPGPGHGPDVRLTRHRDLWRLPRRAVRPRRPAGALSVHQLHQLRAPLHHHPQPPLRPAQHDHARVRPVRGLRSRVPRPRRPALPRAADRLRRLRPAPVARGLGRVRSGRRLGRGHRRRPGRAGAGGDRGHQGSRRVTTSPATQRSDAAVQRLRARKHRLEKPFAVMARDLDVARTLARVDPSEADAPHVGPAAHRPPAPAHRPGPAAISALVAPDNPRLGVLLPYTPLHHLLFAPVPGSDTGSAVPDVLVMTSGNLTDEPICYEDDDARRRLGAIADAWLLHDRPIHVPCDDSVLEIDPDSGSELPLRRSRGYAPLPRPSPVLGRPTLAVGGELKNTFCLASGKDAFMSQHIGDMGSLETWAAFERSTRQLAGLYGIRAPRLAADAHPGYQTKRWAEGASSRPVAEVQHHHAHIASVMAEHGVPAGPARHRHRVRRDGVRNGRHDLGRRGPRRRLRRLRARRAPHVGAAARWRCRHPPALPHGAGAPVGGRDRVGGGPAAGGRRADRGAGGAGAPARTRDRVRGDVEHGTPLRRGELAARPAPPGDLRGGGGHVACNGRPRRRCDLGVPAPAYRFDLTGTELDPSPVLRALVADLRARCGHRRHGRRLSRRRGPR